MDNRYAILGASRGLGRALFETLAGAEPGAHFFLSSRKIKAGEFNSLQVLVFVGDFSVTPIPETFTKALRDFAPTHIIYTAGGGPYGSFEKKKWSDHLWALNLNLLFPGELVHILASSSEHFTNLKSMTLVGSAIAENSPDLLAGSYAAAKHGLRGLIRTVQLEKTIKFKLKLFSPGYILTDMLPLNSNPRLQNKAQPVEVVAQQLAQFIDSPLELS